MKAKLRVSISVQMADFLRPSNQSKKDSLTLQLLEITVPINFNHSGHINPKKIYKLVFKMKIIKIMKGK